MAQAELERLKLAFVHHMCAQVVHADGLIAEGEERFMEGRFPVEQMAAAGFLDAENKLTDVYRFAVERALGVLPVELTDKGKRDLMDTLRQAAQSDALDDDEREANVLIVAARLLGIDPRPYAGD